MSHRCSTAPGLRRAAHALLILLLGLLPASLLAAQWAPGPGFSAGRGHPVGLRHGDLLYAIGGTPFTDGGDQNSAVHRIDDPEGAWIALPSVEGPIIGQGAGVDALGRVIVFGGVAADDPKGDVGRAYIYDDVEGQWNDVAQRSAAAPDAGFAFATDAQARIYSIGGGPGEAATPGAPNVAHVERYDALLDAWQVLAPLPAGRAGAAAVADGLGGILVLGGIDANGTTRLASVLRYDVASGSWSSMIGDLATPRSDHRAVRGADGRIYVLGGRVGAIGAGTTTASVEVLDVGATDWQSGIPMAQPRRLFAAMLGPDDRVWAAGGLDDAGAAIATVERLDTAACPQFAVQPPSADPWRGQTLVIAAQVAGGAPMTLAWERDDVPLEDGPAPGGGTISGATTASLVISDVAAADSGVYVLVATNPCGTTRSEDAVIAVRTPAPIPVQWTATSLHPPGALSSAANATDGTVHLGETGIVDPDYGSLARPAIWTSDAGGFIDLTPAGSVGGAVLAGDADEQVGWWWWPYQCQIGGQWYTCYQRKGAIWHGTAASHEIMHGSGWEYSIVADTDGVDRIGTLSDDDAVGNTFARAVIFNGGYSTTPLPHEGWSKTFGTALDRGRRYGSANTPYPGPVSHAVMWPTNAGPLVDLHPAGASRSWLTGAGDGQQVGTAAYGDVLKPCLWTDSALGVRVLATGGGSVADCAGGYQVGTIGASAVIWNGETDLWHDLGAALPAEYASSSARGLHVAGDGAITVVGSAWNEVAGRAEAIVWRSGSTLAGDVDGDGSVGLSDLIALLAAWGDCSGCPADLDGDGVVGFGDLVILLANWS